MLEKKKSSKKKSGSITGEDEKSISRVSKKKTGKRASPGKTGANKSIKDPDITGPVVRMKLGGVQVQILGTAHVSRESVEDVESFFSSSVPPDGVAVELCQSRFDSIRDPDRWKNTDLAKVIREKKIGLLASSLILSSFQKKIGENTGVRPGEEMTTAIDLAEKKNIPVFLADRDIRTTLSRAWGRVGLWSKLWLTSTLLASLLVKEEIEADEIERMKKEDVLTDLFSQLPARYKSVKNVIIDERDHYLAEKIRRSAVEVKASGGSSLLAVVGAGHLKGIQQVLENNSGVNLEELDTKVDRVKLSSILFWGSVVVLGGAVSYFISQGGKDAAMESLAAWVMGRSIGAGAGAILARAHPYTILITMIAAPISIFIPGSRLWMFSALTEVGINKPRVEDFESIARDTEDAGHLIRALYRNRVLHLFWVIFLVSFGLTLGNLVFWNTVLGGIFSRLF